MQGTVAEQQRAIYDFGNGCPTERFSDYHFFHPARLAASPIRAELESRAKLSDLKAKLIIEAVPSQKLM